MVEGKGAYELPNAYTLVRNFLDDFGPTNFSGGCWMNKLPKKKARAGWHINSEKFQEACNTLGIELPVHIRYQSGSRTVGTHYGCYDESIGNYHKITINQNKIQTYSNETLWHELIHAKQAEEFHTKTGKILPQFYREEYITKNGPHGVKYWRNEYEVEARALTERYASKRMLIDMPDAYGFNHLVDWGKAQVKCIECEAGGSYSQWPEEKRREHSLTHVQHGEIKVKRNRRTKAEMEAALLAKREKQAEKLRLKEEQKRLKEQKKKEREEKAALIYWTIDKDGMRVQPCRICGKDFKQIIRRGRPKLKCDDCKEVM